MAVIIVYAGVQHSVAPPQGHTGASGIYCTQCHRDFDLNSGGGSITPLGLPTGSYIAGKSYNFSIKITHGKADRKRWGFSIEARNTNGQNIGTFSSNNPHAAANGTELSHFNAQVFATASASYTYDSLTWIAPSSTNAPDKEATFYYAANAANGDSRDEGDFIYSGSTMVALPISLTGLAAAISGTSVKLSWSTLSESNSSQFIIEKSSDNQHFIKVASLDASGFSFGKRDYSFTDTKPSYFDRPTYYRLVMIDKDGQKKYSNVLAVTIQATNSFVKKIYPNPVNTGSVMQLTMISNKEQIISVQLFSLSGSKIQELQTKVVKGENVINVPIHKFTASGIHAVTVRTEEQTQQIAVMIQ